MWINYTIENYHINQGYIWTALTMAPKMPKNDMSSTLSALLTKNSCMDQKKKD